MLFLLSATIWGFAFVAQRMGMDHVGPFTFNGIRFFLGAMVLVPLIYRRRTDQPGEVDHRDRTERPGDAFVAHHLKEDERRDDQG